MVSLQRISQQDELISDREGFLATFVHTRAAANFFSWAFSTTSSKEALLLLGPASCGKTTLFRYFVENRAELAARIAGKPGKNGSATAEIAAEQPRAGEVACLDFALPPQGYARPRDPLFGPLMLRRQLAAERVYFDFFDFACLIYLYKTGQLTPERLRNLFPFAARDFVFQLADLILSRSKSELCNEIFNVFSRHLKKDFTPFMMSRQAHEQCLAAIVEAPPETVLLQRLASLLIEDLQASAGLSPQCSPFFLIFDSLEKFSGEGARCSPACDSPTAWLWTLMREAGGSEHVRVMAAGTVSSDTPHTLAFVPTNVSFTRQQLDYFSSAEARQFLADRGITAPRLVQRLLAWTEAETGGCNPLYLGICAELVRRWAKKPLQAVLDEFQMAPVRSEERKYALLRMYLQSTDRPLARLIVALSAEQSAGPQAFLHMSRMLHENPAATDFYRIEAVSFLGNAIGVARHAIIYPQEIRRHLKQYGSKVVKGAHLSMRRYYRECAAAGDDAAAAAAVFHLFGFSAQAGLREWCREMKRAVTDEHFGYIRLLLQLADHLPIDSDFWRGRILRLETAYLLKIGEPARAAQKCRAALDCLDAFLQAHPTDEAGIGAKLSALYRLYRLGVETNGATQSDVLLESALNACDRFSEDAPRLLPVSCFKALFLVECGRLAFWRGDDEGAAAHYQQALSLAEKSSKQAPRHIQILRTSATVHAAVAALHNDLRDASKARAHYEKAIDGYARAVRAGDKNAHTTYRRSVAYRDLGALLVRQGRFIEAETRFNCALAELETAIRLAPRVLHYQIARAEVLARNAEVKAQQRESEQAKEYFDTAVQICTSTLAMNPELVEARRVRAYIRWRYGAFFVDAGEEDAAQEQYLTAIFDLEEILQHPAGMQRIHVLLGTVYQSLAWLDRSQNDEIARNHFATAEQHFKKAREFLPACREATNKLALLWVDCADFYVQRSRYTEAAAALQEAQKLIGESGRTQPIGPGSETVGIKIRLMQAELHSIKPAPNYSGEAKVALAEAAALCDKAARRGEQDLEFHQLRLLLYTQEARLHFELSDYSAAESAAQSGLKLSAALLKKSVEFAWLSEGKAQLLGLLGKIQLQRCEFRGAASRLDQALSAIDSMAAATCPASNANALRTLLLLEFARVHEASSAYDRAEVCLAEAEDVASQMLEYAPDTPDFQNNLGIARLRRGMLHRLLGRLDQAQLCFETAIELFERALTACPENIRMQVNSVSTLLNLGNLQSDRARHTEALRSYSDAILKLQKTLKNAPGDLHATNSKGLTLLRMGDLQMRHGDVDTAISNYEQASLAFDSALSIAPANRAFCTNKGNALQKLAEAFWAAGRTDDAERVSKEAARMYAEMLGAGKADATLLYNLGLALLSAQMHADRAAESNSAEQKLKEAIAALEQAHKLAPGHPKILFVAADAHAAYGERLMDAEETNQSAEKQFERAITAYDLALKVMPDWGPAHHRRAMACMKMGEVQNKTGHDGKAIWSFTQAISGFEKALELTGSRPELHKSYANTHAALGDLQYGSSRYAEALEHYNLAGQQYDAALAQAPDHLELIYCKAIALANLAGTFMALNDPRSALTSYSETATLYTDVLGRSADYANSLLNLGLTLANIGNLQAGASNHDEALDAYTRAIETYEQKIALSPGEIDCALNKGHAYLNMAEVYLQQARQKDANQCYASAVAVFEEILQHSPEEVAAFYNLGLAHAGRAALLLETPEDEAAVQEYRQAIEAYDAVLERQPENVDALYNKGVTFLTLGQIQAGYEQHETARSYCETSIKLFREALRLTPSDVQVREAGRKARSLLEELPGPQSRKRKKRP